MNKSIIVLENRWDRDENQCQLGDCQVINMTSCLRLPQEDFFPWSNTTQDLEYSEVEYDQDGCFFNNMMRNSKEYERYMQFSLGMGILTIVFGCLGLVGNIVSIIVFNTKEFRVNCFNNLLTALNISDSLHIMFAILEVLRYDFPGYYTDLLTHPGVWPYLHYPAYRICLCASIYLIIGVGVERFLAVCRPHHYREVSGNRNRAFLYILPALLSAILVNITRFLEVESTRICVSFTNCHCDLVVEETVEQVTSLRMNTWYIVIYHFWFWILVTGVTPFIILSVLNIKIYNAMSRLKTRLANKNGRPITTTTTTTEITENEKSGDMRKSVQKGKISQQKKEFSLAIILVSTAVTFFLLHTPRILTSLYEAMTIQSQQTCNSRGMDFLPLWFLYSIAAMNMCLVLNASSNILIYLFAGHSFRNKLKAIVWNYK